MSSSSPRLNYLTHPPLLSLRKESFITTQKTSLVARLVKMHLAQFWTKIPIQNLIFTSHAIESALTIKNINYGQRNIMSTLQQQQVFLQFNKFVFLRSVSTYFKLILFRHKTYFLWESITKLTKNYS